MSYIIFFSNVSLLKFVKSNITGKWNSYLRVLKGLANLWIFLVSNVWFSYGDCIFLEGFPAKEAIVLYKLLRVCEMTASWGIFFPTINALSLVFLLCKESEQNWKHTILWVISRYFAFVITAVFVEYWWLFQVKPKQV